MEGSNYIIFSARGGEEVAQILLVCMRIIFRKGRVKSI